MSALCPLLICKKQNKLKCTIARQEEKKNKPKRNEISYWETTTKNKTKGAKHTGAQELKTTSTTGCIKHFLSFTGCQRKTNNNLSHYLKDVLSMTAKRDPDLKISSLLLTVYVIRSYNPILDIFSVHSLK